MEVVTEPNMADHYLELGLKRGATKQEITKAYHRLSLRLHPDKNLGKEAEFQNKFVAIQLAYEVLTDDDKRAAYHQRHTMLKRQWTKYRAFTRRHEDARRNVEDQTRVEEDGRRQTEDRRRRKETNRRANEDRRRAKEDEFRDQQARARAAGHMGPPGAGERYRASQLHRRGNQDRQRVNEDRRRKHEDWARGREIAAREREDARRGEEDARRGKEDARRAEEDAKLAAQKGD